MKKFSSILVFVIIMTMCLSMFAGCSVWDKEPSATEGKHVTASEVLSRSKAAMEKIGANYNMLMSLNVNMDMEMDMFGVEMDMDIPVCLTLDMDICDQNMHGHMSMKGDMKAIMKYEGEEEIQEESIDENAELYVVSNDDKIAIYAFDGEQWEVSEQDNTNTAIDLTVLAPEDIFANAEVTKDENNYIVSVKLADLMKNEKFKELMTSAMQNQSESDSELAGSLEMFKGVDFEKMVGDSTVVYKFDSEYRLVEMSTGKINLDMTAIMEDEAMDESVLSGIDADSFAISIEMNLKLSEFGEIKENSVSVPDEVKNNALPEPEIVFDSNCKNVSTS